MSDDWDLFGFPLCSGNSIQAISNAWRAALRVFARDGTTKCPSLRFPCRKSLGEGTHVGNHGNSSPDWSETPQLASDWPETPQAGLWLAGNTLTKYKTTPSPLSGPLSSVVILACVSDLQMALNSSVYWTWNCLAVRRTNYSKARLFSLWYLWVFNASGRFNVVWVNRRHSGA